MDHSEDDEDTSDRGSVGLGSPETGDDVVEIVGLLPGDSSVESILCSVDINEDNTGWTRPEETIPSSGFYK